MAERERFELSVGITLRTLSKGVVSTTHPSLRIQRLARILTWAKEVVKLSLTGFRGFCQAFETLNFLAKNPARDE